MAKKSSLQILIAYEDLDAGVRAKKVSERVAAQLHFNFNFHTTLYKFDFLGHSQLREEAAMQAAMADLIIVSTNDAGELPKHVKSWLEDWLPVHRKGQSALVALLGQEDAESWAANATRAYLQQLAERGRMDFFCQTDWPEPVRPAGRLRPAMECDAPILAETSSDPRWHGWGLND